MGLLKFLAKLFKCTSSCAFNDQIIDYDFNHHRLVDYELKYKDIEKIHRILSKRQKRETIEGKVHFKRRDTPRPKLANVNEMSII
tara:strand:- start:449 stop:703 length:255 start_codon:yes stop_codon:yes gene_type:complete